MKKNQMIVKVMMTLTLMFGVSATASAQFGKLKNVAKKAVKEKVDPNSSNGNAQAAGVDVAPNGWRYHGGKVHKFVPVERAEVLKFLEVDQTPEQQKVYAYYNLPSNETINAPAKSDYESVAGELISMLWDIHDVEGHLSGMTPEGWMKKANEELPKKIDNAASYGTEPAEIADLFDAELERVKALFHDKNLPNEPKMVGKDVSAYLTQRQAGRAAFKYGLNNLADKGPNANKYKPQFEAKVKAQLKPTKMIAVYLVNGFWQGLYKPNYPQYKDYGNVQEIPMKAYYMKGGKYYYVKGGFRKGYLESDPGMSSKPIADYNPGLEEPIEIPADIAKKYFK